jgi:hypothetical protein
MNDKVLEWTFNIGEKVQVKGKSGFFLVVACFKVENRNFYELSGLRDFLVCQTKLKKVEKL